MKKWFLSLSLLMLGGIDVLFSQESNTYSQREIEMGNRRVERWSQFLSELPPPSDEENLDIEELALAVSSLNLNIRPKDVWRAEEVHDLYWQARRRLLAHEGHATHFVDQIIEIHERLEADETNWPLARSRIAIPINHLKDMPSHEAVTSLMPLLEMQSNWVGNRFYGREQILYRGQKPNDGSLTIAGMASFALSEMGIIDGAPQTVTLPNGQEVGGMSDFLVIAWKEWWQEVVDGKRTFGFEGDPNRYNHLGIVAALPTGGSAPNPLKQSPHPSPPLKIQPQTKGTHSSSPSWIYWTLGILIGFGLILLGLKARKRTYDS